MYPFAHLGIGVALTSRCRDSQQRLLQWWPLLLGTLLPDLIDKPIYYSLAFLKGAWGAEIGFIASTRNFGHTALFLVFISMLAVFTHSPKWIAIAWGVGTHIFIDNFSDVILSRSLSSNGFRTLLWPILGLQFPEIPYRNFAEQITSWANPIPISGEFIGIFFLVYLWRRRSRS